MSVYDNVISALITGQKVKLPATVNVSSLRSAFHRTIKEVRQYGQIIDKKLKVTATVEEDKHYLTVELIDPPVVKFEVVQEEATAQENEDETSSS